MLITCQKCGNPISRQGSNHKYCDTCKKIVKKEQTRIRVQAYRIHKKQNNIRSCQGCGIPITVQGKNHIYCNSCTENIKKENNRIRRNNYYNKWKDHIPPDLGTGWLSQNPKTNFDDNNFKEEYLAVKREFKRLGLDTY